MTRKLLAASMTLMPSSENTLRMKSSLEHLAGPHRGARRPGDHGRHAGKTGEQIAHRVGHHHLLHRMTVSPARKWLQRHQRRQGEAIELREPVGGAALRVGHKGRPGRPGSPWPAEDLGQTASQFMSFILGRPRGTILL